MQTEDIREANRATYEAYCRERAGQVVEKADRDTVAHYDPFDNARLIAEKGDTPETLDYLNVQRATRMAESLGAFDTQVDIAFDGEDLVSFGEKEQLTRRRAVVAAFALEQADPRYAFYTRRTLAEFARKKQENDFMKHDPLGTAKVLFSPAEMVNSRIARKLGMFPEREMAVMQVSWKRAPNILTVRSVSLDRASLDIITAHLAKNRVDVPPDAAAEDFINLSFDATFASQEELDRFVEERIADHDKMVAQKHNGLQTRQGVASRDNRNLAVSLHELTETGAGRLALRQQHKLDIKLSKHVFEPQPLDTMVRNIAQQALHKLRSDGRPLLSEDEQTLLRNLLAADTVSLSDDAHAAALEKIIVLHNTAIEDSYRDFILGDKSAMDWMLSNEMSYTDAVDMVSSGAKGVQEDRVAGGCGDMPVIGPPPTTPNARTGSPTVPHASLLEKYGLEFLKIGTCGACTKKDLLGPCDFCNDCDTQDRIRPGYIKNLIDHRKKQAKQLAKTSIFSGFFAEKQANSRELLKIW